MTTRPLATGPDNTAIPSGLTRRQILTTAVGGALLGSAWAQAFREASGSGSTPTFTIARERSALAALLEYRDRRVLILDGTASEALQQLTELVTGITRQRVDVLLGTSTSLATIPVDFRNRWRISRVYVLPDADRHPQLQLDGREIRIDDLALTSSRVVAGEWRRPSPSPESPWYVSVRHHSARIAIASNAEALGHIGADTRSITAVICNDPDIVSLPTTLTARVLAVPPEANLLEHGQLHQHRLLIPLHRSSAMTFRMTKDGIEPPSSY